MGALTTLPSLVPEGEDPEARDRAVLPLRDYQVPVVDAVMAAWERGVSRQLIALPTGSGKTVVAAHIIRRFSGWNTVFVVHRDELAQQTRQKLALVVPDARVGIVKAGQDDVGAEIVIASAQTLAQSRRLERLNTALRRDGKRVLYISDECHHDRAKSRENAIKVIDPDLLIGLSATPERGDRLGLDRIYKEIVYHLSLVGMIAANRLCRLVGMRVSTEVDLSDVRTVAGEFVEKDLAEAVNVSERNKIIVDAWLKHGSDRKRTVAFCVDVKHAESLRDAFRDADVQAEMVLGETETDARRAIYQSFSDGTLPILTNCMVLTEGFDEPAIDCILMARPTKSRPLYVQCVGRGARLSPGKDDCLVFDFVDVTAKHKLVTLPKLAGKAELEGRTEIGDEEDVEDDDVREEQAVFDLVEFTQDRIRKHLMQAELVNLFDTSVHLWREVDGLFMAKAGRSSFLVLLKNSDGYLPVKIANYQSNGWQRTKQDRLYDIPLPIETAMGIAEGYIEFDDVAFKDSDWRQGKSKPTPKQTAFARKLGIEVTPKMTKTNVSDAIDEHMFRLMARRAGVVPK